MATRRPRRQDINRYVIYHGHTIKPELHLASRTAWALAFYAGARGITVGDLIADLCDEWARAWEGDLGETDRRAFAEYIPFNRGPYGPRRASGENPGTPA